MLLYPRMSQDPLDSQSAAQRPRVMIGGVGLPWRRDLDLGRLIVEELARGDWPAGVIAEDLSYSAHRVMHTLQDLQPHKLILVGATDRGGTPGSVTSYRAGNLELDEDDVAARLGESVGGVIDLDHILVVNQHFGSLPDDTVVIEVETGDQEFGTGYSKPVEGAIERVIALIRAEVGDV